MKNKFIPLEEYTRNKPKTEYLYENIWKESTTCLLHGAADVDKSAIAFEIASKIASPDRRVIYVNTEDRADDFSVSESKPSNILIFTPDYESSDDPTDYADLVIAGIQEAIDTTGVRTFVIDSITHIAALSFGRNASAAYVMKRLAALQVRYKLSLLIIASDTTKSADRALITLSASQIKHTETTEKSECPECAECSNYSENSEYSETSECSKCPKCSETSECSKCPKCTETSETSECSESSETSEPPAPIKKQTRRKLSRRDRRILRRHSQPHR